jgi:multiple sugar transport system permease protein
MLRRAPSRDALAVIALTGPALLWYGLFMVVPLVSMFYLGMLEWNSLIAAPRFAGLANFGRVLGDPIFWTAVRNTAVHLVATLPVMIPLAFLLGYFLSRRPPGYRVLSVIFFTPAIVSVSTRAMLFTGIYQQDGILNAFLRAIGLSEFTHTWLADPATALWTIVIVDLWAGIGFTGVIFAAALSAISDDIYEAARLDGASTWTVIWRIAYPMTRQFVGVMLMLQFLWLLLTSAQNVLLLTEGGPGSVSMTLSYLLFDQAFVSTRVGYSQAIGVVLFLVGLAGMFLIRTAFRRADR